MPEYKLPKPKKSAKTESVPSVGDDATWRRRVHLPANKAIVGAVKAGEEVSVTITGKVLGTSLSEGADGEIGNIEIDTDHVSVYPTKEETPGEYMARRRKT